MKNHGKGLGISINEPNQVQSESKSPTIPMAPMKAWRPLRQWPFVSHPRQADIDAYRSIPSRWA